MDAVRPDRRQEQEHLVREKVHRDEEEADRVGQGLGDAVERREGKTRKGAQRRLLVVLVVHVVEFPAFRFVFFFFLKRGGGRIRRKEKRKEKRKEECVLRVIFLLFSHFPPIRAL